MIYLEATWQSKLREALRDVKEEEGIGKWGNHHTCSLQKAQKCHMGKCFPSNWPVCTNEGIKEHRVIGGGMRDHAVTDGFSRPGPLPIISTLHPEKTPWNVLMFFLKGMKHVSCVWERSQLTASPVYLEGFSPVLGCWGYGVALPWRFISDL